MSDIEKEVNRELKIEWKTCIRIGITLFLLFLGITYWETVVKLGGLCVEAASSLLLGAVIAYLINILMSCYERYYFPKSQKAAVVKSRRIVCMLAAMITLVGVVILIINLVIPELVDCVKLLVAEIPEALEIVFKWIRANEDLASVVPEDVLAQLASTDWQEKVTQVATFLLEGVGGAAQMAVSAVSSVTSFIMEFVIGFIFSIYLLLEKETLIGQFKRFMNHYVKNSWNEKIQYVLSTLNECFHKFIVGQCIEAVVLGVLCAVGMLILRLPYAVMIGTLIGFTALIPVAGAYIGGAVGAFMILTVDPIKVVWFLIFLVILQQLEGNLIYPKVVGSSIGLPGVWVLAAVTVGGGIYGITGMLLGVPIAAAVYQMLQKDLHRREGLIPETVESIRETEEEAETSEEPEHSEKEE